MPAKNKRRRNDFDPHSDLHAHMQAYQCAEEWAQKCIRVFVRSPGVFSCGPRFGTLGAARWEM
jgi:hypothetical protein